MIANIRLKQACAALAAGELIAYPTEGVWGLGCDPDNQHALQSLLDYKQRPWHKGLILIASRIEQLQPYAASDLQQINSHKTDRPTTWLVERSDYASDLLAGSGHEIAVRVTSHEASAALCDAWGGAVVSTSANPAGKPAAMSRLDVYQYFRGQLPFILPGILGGLDGPSSIIRLQTGEQLR